MKMFFENVLEINKKHKIKGVKSFLEIALGVFVLLFVAGCLSTSTSLPTGASKSEQASETNQSTLPENASLAAGDRALAQRDFTLADENYKKAETKAAPTGSDDYYTQGIYRIAAAARARQAFIKLQYQDVSGAGAGYRNAIENLRADFEQHLAILDSPEEKIIRLARNTSVGFAVDQITSFLSGKLSGSVGNEIRKHLVNMSDTVTQMLSVPPPQVEDVEIADEVESHVIRIPVIPDAGYLRYIGKVRTERGQCTGSLVGPSIVITNSHCIFDGGKEYGEGETKLKKGDFKFRHEWLYETIEYPVTAYHTHEGHSGGWDGTVANDWAILELGPSDKGFVATDYLPAIDDARKISQLKKEGSTVFLAGYNGDLNHGFYLTMHWDCKFDHNTFADGMVYHACDTYKGSSGSPIFLIDEHGNPHVVAVNAGNTHDSKREPYTQFGVNPQQYYPTLAKLLAKAGVQ